MTSTKQINFMSSAGKPPTPSKELEENPGLRLARPTRCRLLRPVRCRTRSGLMSTRSRLWLRRALPGMLSCWSGRCSWTAGTSRIQLEIALQSSDPLIFRRNLKSKFPYFFKRFFVELVFTVLRTHDRLTTKLFSDGTNGAAGASGAAGPPGPPGASAFCIQNM